MRPYILKQLKAIQMAKIDIKEDKYKYEIPKYNKPRYTPGRLYIIKVSNELINNPNSLLAINWNHGNSPMHQYYKCYVGEVYGAIIKCDCLAVNPITKQDEVEVFSGYLDINYIEQVEGF
jgi:arginine repressor